ncbi:hypothetical protein HZA33_02755 [Candidatus Pacearchaeota archaeon]|nr:hypothetical protein [Candidatus Pacearchaeota archaeon]
MNNFSEKKRKQLSKQDKSNKGDVDRPILKLVSRINYKKEYYTTSSCAGRIILIKDADTKKENLFLFRTHDKLNYKKFIKELKKALSYKKLIYFKQEPCILHVACKSLSDAQKLVDKAKFAGLKRSGIMATRKRIICELMSTEQIAMPLADKGKLLVSDNFLRLLVREADRKLERTRKKINKLYKLL